MATNNSLISSTWDLSKKLLAKQAIPLGLLFLIGTAITFNLEDAAANVPPKEETLRLILHGMLGLWDLGSGLLMLLILSWGLHAAQPLKGPRFLNEPFKRAYIGSFFAEYLRLLGSVILWGLLFLIPGFVQYVRLTFVPFVTLFSADYEAGEVDALELSRKLTKNVFWTLVAVLVVTTAIEVALQFGTNSNSTLHSFPFRFLAEVLSLLISVWTYSFMIVIFKRQMETSWN